MISIYKKYVFFSLACKKTSLWPHLWLRQKNGVGSFRKETTVIKIQYFFKFTGEGWWGKGGFEIKNISVCSTSFENMVAPSPIGCLSRPQTSFLIKVRGQPWLLPLAIHKIHANGSGKPTTYNIACYGRHCYENCRKAYQCAWTYSDKGLGTNQSVRNSNIRLKRAKWRQDTLKGAEPSVCWRFCVQMLKLFLHSKK